MCIKVRSLNVNNYITRVINAEHIFLLIDH